jgi:hypothetical protein
MMTDDFERLTGALLTEEGRRCAESDGRGDPIGGAAVTLKTGGVKL